MTSSPFLHHRFVAAKEPGRRPLLLLHGTGGDENDLLPFGMAVAPGAPLLSPRGAIEENGMPRFFRRLAEGVFDEVDLRRRSADLAEFVITSRERYHLEAPIAIGFSNGANIAAALLFLHPGVLNGAVLLRAMVPFRQVPSAELAKTPVLLLSGAADPIVTPNNAAKLVTQLQEAGASVTHRVLQGGHGLSEADVAAAADWLKGCV